VGGQARSEAFSPRMLLEILRADRDYREYMFWMGVYGGGNLMLTSQLVVILTERLAMPPSAPDRDARGAAAGGAAAVRADVGTPVRRRARGAVSGAPGPG
jgi:hypothetical protein